MDLAHLYEYIFLFFLTVLTIPVWSKYRSLKTSPGHEPRVSGISPLLLTIFCIFFIGMRPQSGVFVDMMNYVTHYYTLFYGEPFCFTWNTENFLFDNYYHFLAALKADISIFFFTIALIYFGAAYVGIRRLFPNHTLAVYLMYLGAFSTFSYATNGIKAGAAASMFILAISYWNNLKYCIPLMILTLGFHHSMKMPIAAFFIAYFFKKPKYYFYVWTMCFLFALAHITYFQNLFSSMADDADGYLNISSLEGGNRKTGLRIDFVLYSVVPIWAGYLTVIKRKLNISPTYRILLCTYMVSNAVWMLCMYASFTNRIAYLSWLMYPVVLAYPFLYEQKSDNRYKVFASVLLLHLAFTLFMELVYYA